MTQLWTLLRAEPCISLGIWELHYPCHTAVRPFLFFPTGHLRCGGAVPPLRAAAGRWDRGCQRPPADSSGPGAGNQRSVHDYVKVARVCLVACLGKHLGIGKFGPCAGPGGRAAVWTLPRLQRDRLLGLHVASTGLHVEERSQLTLGFLQDSQRPSAESLGSLLLCGWR